MSSYLFGNFLLVGLFGRTSPAVVLSTDVPFLRTLQCEHRLVQITRTFCRQIDRGVDLGDTMRSLFTSTFFTCAPKVAA